MTNGTRDWLYVSLMLFGLIAGMIIMRGIYTLTEVTSVASECYIQGVQIDCDAMTTTLHNDSITWVAFNVDDNPVTIKVISHFMEIDNER